MRPRCTRLGPWLLTPCQTFGRVGGPSESGEFLLRSLVAILYTSQFGASCCDVPQGEAGAWIAVSRLTNTAHIHEIAMMPDGQLDKLKPEEVINLIKYLQTTEQVELPQ